MEIGKKDINKPQYYHRLCCDPDKLLAGEAESLGLPDQLPGLPPGAVQHKHPTLSPLDLKIKLLWKFYIVRSVYQNQNVYKPGDILRLKRDRRQFWTDLETYLYKQLWDGRTRRQTLTCLAAC